MREVPSKGTYVAGATEKLVTSASEMMQMMHEGNLCHAHLNHTRNRPDPPPLHSRRIHAPAIVRLLGHRYRTTEATSCNEVSSRSHAVLQVSVHSKPRFGEGAAKLGKLSMIDLAGSERATKTDNKGQRLTEGANINRSLLALGNCINALADKTKKASHVPYRDSKLTRLLKDSLGGNCLTTMITNVSPAHDQARPGLGMGVQPAPLLPLALTPKAARLV